jgi:hypothetical protein
LVDGPGVTAEAGYVHRSRLVEHGTLAIRGFHGIEGVSHRDGGGTGKREGGWSTTDHWSPAAPPTTTHTYVLSAN